MRIEEPGLSDEWWNDLLAEKEDLILKTHTFTIFKNYRIEIFCQFICKKCNFKLSIADNGAIWEANTNNRDIITCDEFIIKNILE